MKKQLACAFIALLGFATLPADASVSLLDKDDWKINMAGFIEVDTIHDSTPSFAETLGNAPVVRPTAGETGREQFSIRNTRLAFEVLPPLSDNWKTRAYFEFDLLGYDPNTADQSEANFYNSPTFRVRHAFLSAEKDGWLLLAGQTWAFLGWQPYYFMPSVQIAPVPGMLYSRTAQVRALKTIDLDDDNKFQVGLGVMRPPERSSEYPALEGGLRYVMGSRTAGFTAGATGPLKPQPASVGISGTVRDFAIPNPVTSAASPTTHYLGSAGAADILIPVLASPDGKDVSNTLMIGGEFTLGKGDGDEFNSWTGNTPSPSNTGGPNALANYKNYALDGGIGGIDSTTSFFLLDVKTFNGYLQYYLPGGTDTWVSGGYGWLNSDNAANLAGLAKVAYSKEEVVFANVFHNFTPQLRMGAEYAHVSTTYVDGLVAPDNRVQISAWLIF